MEASLQSSTVALFGMLWSWRSPRNERLHRRHLADVPLDRQRARPSAAAGVGAVEHRQMLGLDVPRPLQRHGGTAEAVGGVDLSPANPNAANTSRAGSSGSSSAPGAMSNRSTQKRSPNVIY